MSPGFRLCIYVIMLGTKGGRFGCRHQRARQGGSFETVVLATPYTATVSKAAS